MRFGRVVRPYSGVCGLPFMQLLFSLRTSNAILTDLPFFTEKTMVDRKQSLSIVPNLYRYPNSIGQSSSFFFHRPVGVMVLVILSVVLETIPTSIVFSRQRF